MKEFDYVITDEVGIHARPAGLLVKEAKKYESKIVLSKDGRKAEATKLMAVMGLGVKCGVVGIDILDHCLDIVVNLALGAVVGVRSLLFAMRLFRCCIIVVAGCFSLLCGRCLLLRLVAVELAEDLQRPFRLFLLLSLLDEKHLKACHLVCKRGDLS